MTILSLFVILLSQPSLAAPPAAPTIGWPKDGRVFSRVAQNMGGRCENGSTVSISGSIQGSPLSLTCSSGRYSSNIRLTNGSGSKTLSVSQRNKDGSSPSTSISVILQGSSVATPGISSPAAQSWVRSVSQTVSGTCTTGASVRVFGDLSAAANVSCNNSSYSASVQLTSSQGQKTIRVTQQVGSNTSAESSRAVNLDTVAPSAPTVSSPVSGATIRDQNITLAGSCEVSATVRVSGAIVGSSANLSCDSAGAFSSALQVTSGTGTKSISITQTDRAGNVSSARQISVVLAADTGNPGLEIRNSNRVFLSGHSLVDYPLMKYLTQVTGRTSDSFNFNQQLVGGSPIRVRTKGENSGASGYPGYSLGDNRQGSGMNVISEIRNPRTLGNGEKYDTLIITENHSMIPALLYENTLQYLRQYHDVAISGNAATRTFFYHSWLDINKSNPMAWVNHERRTQTAWECTASKVNQSLQTSGRSDRLRLLPAGGALANLVERVVNNEIPEISGSTVQRMNMLFRDNVHYTELAGYYMSLVVYSSIYGKSPVGAAVPSELGISADLGRRLQTIAWNFVSSYYASAANSTARSMSSCREFFVNTYCSSYYTHQGDTGQISSCRDFFGRANDSGNPFRDASFSPLPVP